MIDETTHTQQQHRVKTVHVFREVNGCKEEIQYTQMESNVSFKGVVCPSNQFRIGTKTTKTRTVAQETGTVGTSSGYNVEETFY